MKERLISILTLLMDAPENRLDLYIDLLSALVNSARYSDRDRALCTVMDEDFCEKCEGIANRYGEPWWKAVQVYTELSRSGAVRYRTCEARFVLAADWFGTEEWNRKGAV